MKPEGIQDEIPKRKIAFPSIVRSLENNPKNKSNFLSFKKRSDKRVTTKYSNKNKNENENVISIRKKKIIERQNVDDNDDYVEN